MVYRKDRNEGLYIGAWGGKEIDMMYEYSTNGLPLVMS